MQYACSLNMSFGLFYLLQRDINVGKTNTSGTIARLFNQLCNVVLLAFSITVRWFGLC